MPLNKELVELGADWIKEQNISGLETGKFSSPLDISPKRLEALGSIIDENTKLLRAIEKFVVRNYCYGSKSDREDYVTSVSCKDIYELRKVLEDCKT